MAFQRITTNLISASKRYEMLDGVRHVVVPVVMLTEGVHNGSQGPLLYLGEEMSKHPYTWNHRPAVIQHPTLNGEGISACDPKVVEQQRVGLLFNTGYPGKLRSESWLAEDKLQRVDNRVLTAINNNQIMEVSTGLFHDIEMVSGEWNGEKYVGIVRNIRPDHLAILPDAKGACSVEDGAGLNRNQNGDELSYIDIKDQLRVLLAPRTATPSPFVSPENGIEPPWVYIVDLYVKYVIYELGDKMFKQGYKVKSGKVSLDGNSEPVRRQTTYVTANGQVFRSESHFSALPAVEQTGNLDTTTPPETPPMAQPTTTNTIHSGTGPLVQDVLKTAAAAANPPPTPTAERTHQVSALIQQHGFKEEDRSWLSGLPDDQFGRLAGVVTKPAPAATSLPSVTPPAGMVAQPPTQGATVPTPAPAQNMSMEDYLRTLPPWMASTVRRSMAWEQQQKESLVSTILSCNSNRFSKEFLLTKTPEELAGIAALAGLGAGQPTANYAGQAEVPMFLTNNSTPGMQQAPQGRVLVVPAVLAPNGNGKKTA